MGHFPFYQIDDEGWLHTGDVGRFDEDQFLYITARIKELVITAGGENVPPVIIEECIKKELPFISNAMIVGDNKKYVNLFCFVFFAFSSSFNIIAVVTHSSYINLVEVIFNLYVPES